MSAVHFVIGVLTVVFAISPSLAQECQPGNTEPPSEGARRRAAVEYIMAVNAAQERAQQQVGRYLPLNELAGLPSVPVGFVPTIIAEQWSFAAIVKDVFGACGFAVFSDERGVVYDAHPRTGSRQAPKPPVDEQ